MLHPPPTVVEIARKLTDAGYETWCVGGAIRDALLGIANNDWDIATAAPPAVMQRLFRHTVPLGIEFGTVGVLDRHGVMHEVTTFRRDVTNDGRHAVVEFGVSLVEDLRRRDFTINAIAYDPFRHVLFDPFDGRRDLEHRLVRAVGVPLERFVEDRLRVLRGIRFASRFSFEIEPVTWQAIVESAPHLGRLSAERVKQELDKTLEQAAVPTKAFRLWQRAGVFASLISALDGVGDDVLYAVDALPAPRAVMTAARRQYRRQLRLAALFSATPAPGAVKAMNALRASKQETAFVGALVERWQAVGREMGVAIASATIPAPQQIRRWAAAIGRVRVRAFMRVAWARWTGAARIAMTDDTASAPGTVAVAVTAAANAAANVAQAGERFPNASIARVLYRELLEAARGAAIEIADLAVDGDDLRSAGIPNGPHYGVLLRGMLERVLDDPAENTRDTLLAYARRRYAELADRPSPDAGSNRQP